MARDKSGRKPKPKTQPAPQGEHGVAYAPPRRFRFNPNLPEVRKIAESIPAGLLSIVANESARYTVFMGDTLSLAMPYSSRYSIHTGCYVVDSCNRAVMGMKDSEDWIMFMGDDHRFPPEFVLKLLGLMYHHDLDVIAPTCFKRSFPPEPVIYKYREVDPEMASTYAYNKKEGKALFPINLDDYPGGGLIEVDAVGSAGMAVRRRVLEAMEPPWFQLGQEQWGEDLDFCRRVQEAGFRIHVDLDMSLGHIVNTTLWPVRSPAGKWACEYDFGQQGGFVLGL